jgi:uncharacterized protein
LIRDWERHRGVRRSAKVAAVGVLVPVVAVSLAFGGLPAWAQWAVGGLAAVGAGVVLFVVPTVRDDG